MADGSYRRVEDVRAGEMVWTVNEDTWSIEAKPVLAVLANGVKETIEVRTRTTRIRCTPNHPLYANGKWIEAGDLVVNDLIATPKTLAGSDHQPRPDHEVDFLAIWLAEGSRYVVTKPTPEIVDILRSAVGVWGAHLNTKDNLNWYIQHPAAHRRGGNTREVRHPIRLWLESQGLWGKISKTKFIPDWVYRLPDHQLARFLNLFIACDGCVTHKMKETWSLEIGLANEHLIRQLSELLLRFGVRGSIRHKIHAARGKDGNPFESWSFMTSDSVSLSHFCTKIGAVAKEHLVEKVLKAVDMSSGCGNVYFPLSYDDGEAMMPPFDARGKELHGILRAWRKQDRNRIAGKRLDQLRPWINKTCSRLMDSDLAWEEVKEISPAGEVETWDLSLADNHNFIADGLVTHNTKMIISMGSDAAIRGKRVGIFAPEHKQLAEPYDEILSILKPISSGSNKSDGFIKTNTSGKVDFWRLIDNELAGRGREYDLVLIDEAAFTKNGQMIDIWNKSIVPTTATKPNAEYWVFSTPNGDDPENFFWKVCNDPAMEFEQFHAPSTTNPMVSQEWLDGEKRRLHPLAWQQEVEAEFVSWAGIAFFDPEKWLEDNAPVPWPARCDSVFCVIDSATKTGTKNDSTAVVFFARNQYTGYKLVVLDYDLVQIEGALLETWLPVVLQRLEDMAAKCGARMGSLGAFIEDKASGEILLQQARRRGLKATPIDGRLTALGKDERAISVSGYHYRGDVKMSDVAYNNVFVHKGVSRNHLISQVTSFRVGDPDAAKRSDDALDGYTYGLSLALGDGDGF